MSDGGALQEQKLAKLKGLLTDAMQQIRKKLEVLQRFIESLDDVENVSNDTKLVCTLLIEVKELLKNFPAIASDAKRPELASQCSRFERFQHNVLAMVEDTHARLYTVEEFVCSTQSLPKAMTVAVTIRDITKHLKVVSSRGPRIVNLPGDLSRSETVSAEVSTSVVDIVQYYTNLEKDKVQLSPTVEDPAVRQVREKKREAPESPSRVTDAANRPKRRRRRRRMTMEQQECMEHVVNAKMSTLTKNRAELFQNMLNEKSMKKIFDEEREVKKKEAIVRYLDDSKIYRCGRLKKKYYTVRSFGKTWKTLWWILDSEHLSCFQSRSAQLPLKQYKLDSLTRCSWEGKITKDKSATEDMLSITLWGKNERKLMLGAETPETLTAWVLAINSVQTYKKMEKTILNPIEKHLLLQWVWKDNFVGGAIKSSYDEEWSYSQSGVLKSTLGLPVSLAYRWDGEMLIGLNDLSTNLGSGKWDGVSLVWYDNAANGMITTPSMRYDWDSVEREFSNAVEQHQVWTWTRNFLVSKFGGGEWIVEGEFPEPVIMFLQAMRTSRLSRMVEVETEDEAYGVGSARFAPHDEREPQSSGGVVLEAEEEGDMPSAPRDLVDADGSQMAEDAATGIEAEEKVEAKKEEKQAIKEEDEKAICQKREDELAEITALVGEAEKVFDAEFKEGEDSVGTDEALTPGQRKRKKKKKKGKRKGRKSSRAMEDKEVMDQAVAAAGAGEKRLAEADASETKVVEEEGSVPTVGDAAGVEAVIDKGETADDTGSKEEVAQGASSYGQDGVVEACEATNEKAKEIKEDMEEDKEEKEKEKEEKEEKKEDKEEEQNDTVKRDATLAEIDEEQASQ